MVAIFADIQRKGTNSNSASSSENGTKWWNFFYNKLVMYSLADLYIFLSSLFTDFSLTFDFSFGQFFFSKILVKK